MSYWQSQPPESTIDIKTYREFSSPRSDDMQLTPHHLSKEEDHHGSQISSLRFFWPPYELSQNTSGSSSHSHDLNPLDLPDVPHQGFRTADVPSVTEMSNKPLDTLLYATPVRHSTLEPYPSPRPHSNASSPNPHSYASLAGSIRGLTDAAATTSSLPLKLESLDFRDESDPSRSSLEAAGQHLMDTSGSSIASSNRGSDNDLDDTGDGEDDDASELAAKEHASGSRRSLRNISHSSASGQGISASARLTAREKELADARRTRHKCTADQLVQLQAFFETNRNPKGKVREELANRLGMPERSVQIWFQNKRARLRRVCKARGLRESGELNVCALMAWPTSPSGLPPSLRGKQSKGKRKEKLSTATSPLDDPSLDVSLPSASPPQLHVRYQASPTSESPEEGLSPTLPALRDATMLQSDPCTAPTCPSLRAKSKATDEGLEDEKLVPPRMSRTSGSSRSERSSESGSRRIAKQSKLSIETMQTLTPLPAYSLCIGSWRRVTPLTCFYSRRLRTLSWTLKADSVGFKIDVPVTSIKYLTFNGPVPPSMSELAEGIHQPLGLLKVELEKPPQFFMETFRSAEPPGEPEAPKNLWRQCDDFTEHQEGTNCPSHVLSGPFELLRSAVVSLRESDSVLRDRLGIYDSITTGIDPAAATSEHMLASSSASPSGSQVSHRYQPGPPPPLLRQYSWGKEAPSFVSSAATNFAMQSPAASAAAYAPHHLRAGPHQLTNVSPDSYWPHPEDSAPVEDSGRERRQDLDSHLLESRSPVGGWLDHALGSNEVIRPTHSPVEMMSTASTHSSNAHELGSAGGHLTQTGWQHPNRSFSSLGSRSWHNTTEHSNEQGFGLQSAGGASSYVYGEAGGQDQGQSMMLGYGGSSGANVPWSSSAILTHDNPLPVSWTSNHTYRSGLESGTTEIRAQEHSGQDVNCNITVTSISPNLSLAMPRVAPSPLPVNAMPTSDALFLAMQAEEGPTRLAPQHAISLSRPQTASQSPRDTSAHVPSLSAVSHYGMSDAADAAAAPATPNSSANTAA